MKSSLIFLNFVILLNWTMSNIRLKKIISLLSNPRIFICTMFWMMVLVFVGTIAQKDLGLYEAQQRFFSCWIAWFGFFPSPGGRTLLMLMTINITFFMLKPTFWSIKKAGIIVTHIGVLLLLVGGGITAWFSSEGNMIIEEGHASNFIVDLFAKELVIVDLKNIGYDEITTINDKLLKRKGFINHESLPFNIEVLEYYINCEPIRRIETASKEYKGLAQNFYLNEIDLDKEIELNRAGITFRVSDTGYIYSLFLDQQVPQTITISSDKEYTVALRRERTYLPFTLHLNDFKKTLHPGTDIAKSFSSDVILKDENISRPVLIKMNEPLRYKNYTFYQSSFNEGPNRDTTILAVVKNYGRLFPYISSLTISLGLLIHMFLRFPFIFNRRKIKAKDA